MTEGPCPSCGAPVAFTAGSAQVLVCPHCQTVVGRKGAALEARGKVARLVDTGSPLQLGLTGTHAGVGFRLVGHLQKSRGDALWDEWYLELDDGRRGWLSESEGALHLSFFVDERPGLTYDGLHLRATFEAERQRFVVEERSEAALVSAEGELPSDVAREGRLFYVDATGPSGAFATLDFGERTVGAELYVGRRVEWEALGLDRSQLRPRAKRVELVQARCTQCNGPLELRAPDRTRRVGCPYCGALLDASQGKLAFLQALEKPDHAPQVPFGAKGTLEGTEWTCIGMLVRSVTVEGVRYPWDEYLLWNPTRGFAWLVLSGGQWSFLASVPAGEVEERGFHRGLRHRGVHFRPFSRGVATTEYVLGELYWEVAAGDRVKAAEYVAPPLLMSAEEEGGGEELSYSRGTWLPPEAVQRAFGLEKLPRPEGVAPAEPNPYRPRAWRGLKWAALYAALAFLLFGLFTVLSPTEEYARLSGALAPDAVRGSPELVASSAPFTLPRRMALRLELAATLDEDWLGAEVELVESVTGKVRSAYLHASHFQGQGSDGAWGEGRAVDEARLPGVQGGVYTLRVVPSFERLHPGGPRPRTYEVRVTGAAPGAGPLVFTWVVLFAVPLVLALRASGFETRRWNESNLDG